MRTFVLLFALLAVANCSVINDIFQEVTVDEFGKTMVESIELQLSSGASIDVLITSIRSVRDGLRGQLQDGEDHHEAQSDSCRDDLAEYNSQHSDAQATMDKFTTMKDLDESTLQSRTDEQVARRAELKERNDMVDHMTSERQKETVRFNQLLDEHRTVSDMLYEVRDIINTRLLNKEEFLQTNTNMFMDVSSKLRSYKIEKKGRAHGYMVLFQLLAGMLEKNTQHHGDQTVVQGLLDIVDQIEENLEASLAIERAAEAERAKDFDELMARLNEAVNYCKSSLNDLAAQIFTLEARVAAANQRFAVAEESLSDWATRILDRQVECKTQTDVWENFYNNISAELSTCAKVMYLLEDKRALLARYGL